MTSDASSNHRAGPEPVPDASLLRRLRGGDEDAATTLYYRYANRLKRLAEAKTSSDVAVRLDSDGVVQSVFRTFFRRVAIGQYDVPEGEELWKLFLVIALNKIRGGAAFHRAAKRDVAKTQALLDHDSHTEHSGRDENAHAVLKLTIEELLERLPIRQRQIILLRIDGWEVQEIAARSRRSKRSVERILQKFREQLSALTGEL